MSLRWYAFLCSFGSDVLFTIDHLRSISFFCQHAHHDWLTKEYISNLFLVISAEGMQLSIGNKVGLWFVYRIEFIFHFVKVHNTLSWLYSSVASCYLGREILLLLHICVRQTVDEFLKFLIQIMLLNFLKYSLV